MSAGIGMTSARTRDRLVARLRAQGIADERVLDVIRRIPRHEFVDEALAHRAYEDTALPIGSAQTISQPYVVARMTEALLGGGRPGRVLEVGTGSGYQSAVLAPLVDELYSVERVAVLLERAVERLNRLPWTNIHVRLDDGHIGWPEHAPYDGIIVTAAAERLPQQLVEQLADGGRLVVPIGAGAVQELLLFERDGTRLARRLLERVRFVPLLAGIA